MKWNASQLPRWLRKNINENEPHGEERGQEKGEAAADSFGEASAAPGAVTVPTDSLGSLTKSCWENRDLGQKSVLAAP